jgi:glycosyltransferase involved in cell wall biosynthesis
MHVCLVYDCLFPWTVGGAERWMRNVGEALAENGHEVTYLTRRQWPEGDEPDVPGVRVVAVSPPSELYGADGKRRIAPPLRFGAGVLRHLMRHGHRYDVVHTASFPYFSLLAAALARGRGGYRLVADWHEVWSRSYWREYLGHLGWAGALVQRACARVRQRAFCFSHLHAERLRREGLRGEVTVLRGEWPGSLERPEPAPADPVVVFAGRLIPEKQAPAVVAAVASAARRMPALRGVVYGDGPELEAVHAEIVRLGADDLVSAPGFVSAEELDDRLRRALCLLLPSRREGYGMVLVEAASLGVPSVTVAAPDNAAVEHIEEGVNGFVAPSTDPERLAEAILAVAEGGAALRTSTADWFAANARELSLHTSLERVLESYASANARV